MKIKNLKPRTIVLTTLALVTGGVTIKKGFEYIPRYFETVPEAFTFQGNDSLVDYYLNPLDKENKFFVVDAGNSNDKKWWDLNVLSHITNENIALEINTEATSADEMLKDYYYVRNLVEEHNINYPVYLNIDKLFENKMEEERRNYIISTFINLCENSNIKPGISGSDKYLEQIANLSIDTERFVKMTDNFEFSSNYNLVKTPRGTIYTKKELKDEIESNYLNKIERKKLTKDNIEFEIVAKGIDVSSYQGQIDYSKLPDDINYMIIRLCDFACRDENNDIIIDKEFYRNIEECEKREIPYGVYAVTRATSKEEIKEEADFISKHLKEKKVTYPVYLDIEPDYREYAENENNISDETFTDMVRIWENTIKDNGFIPGVYANTNDFTILNNKTNNKLEEMETWIASYGTNEERNYNDIISLNTPLVGKINAHQITSTGKILGIEGNVDVNVSFTDYEKIKKERNIFSSDFGKTAVEVGGALALVIGVPKVYKKVKQKIKKEA